ncbi:hypothetical protein D9757_005546 [Collybiopsis confluens]|uniref:Uncharacterized protein n=1 Tax=Collybiopsis confluens TaxID=2823264 RepID=A0A8H5M9F7_9AGAR|nr:hypothetical protein D9757_005546 [Collybiopsis confluens]
MSNVPTKEKPGRLRFTPIEPGLFIVYPSADSLIPEIEVQMTSLKPNRINEAPASLVQSPPYVETQGDCKTSAFGLFMANAGMREDDPLGLDRLLAPTLMTNQCPSHPFADSPPQSADRARFQYGFAVSDGEALRRHFFWESELRVEVSDGYGLGLGMNSGDGRLRHRGSGDDATKMVVRGPAGLFGSNRRKPLGTGHYMASELRGGVDLGIGHTKWTLPPPDSALQDYQCFQHVAKT